MEPRLPRRSLTLGRLHDLCVPRFPHMQNRGDIHAHLRTGLSEGGMSKAIKVPGGEWTLGKCELEPRAV